MQQILILVLITAPGNSPACPGRVCEFRSGRVFPHFRLAVLFLITSGDEFERPLHMLMATPSGFEPLTYRLGGGCSILLSYGAGDGLHYRLNTLAIHRKIGIEGNESSAMFFRGIPEMRRPTMMCTAWTTGLPREPVGQLQLHLDEAGEQDGCVPGLRGTVSVGNGIALTCEYVPGRPWSLPSSTAARARDRTLQRSRNCSVVFTVFPRAVTSKPDRPEAMSCDNTAAETFRCAPVKARKDSAVLNLDTIRWFAGGEPWSTVMLSPVTSFVQTTG